MRKFFLFALAVTMLTSCDYFKGSSNKEDETEEEESPKKKKKKKKVSEEDEEESTEDETADEETTTKKKSRSTSDDDDDVSEYESNSGWTSKEKTLFLTTCVDKAAQSVGESRAKTYCSCMLDKIQSKYSSYTKANSMTESDLTSMAAECNR